MSDKNPKKTNKILDNDPFFPTRELVKQESLFSFLSPLEATEEQVIEITRYNYIKSNFIDKADYKVNFSAFLKVFESVYKGGKFDTYKNHIKNGESKFHRLFNIIDKFKRPNEELKSNEVESIKNFINKMDPDYDAVQLLENISKIITETRSKDCLARIEKILELKKESQDKPEEIDKTRLVITDIARGSENISRHNAKHINLSRANFVQPSRRQGVYIKPYEAHNSPNRRNKNPDNTPSPPHKP